MNIRYLLERTMTKVKGMKFSCGAFTAVLGRIFIGKLCIALGFTILMYHPQDYISEYYGIIHESGKSFEIWNSSNAYDTLIKAYAFNVTNADAFLQGKEKLRVQEVGPFVYREVMQQQELKFDHEKGTIDSNPRYRLEWEPEMNTLLEDTPLMMPNIAMLFFSNKIASDYWWFQSPLNVLIRQSESQPIVNQTWKQFAFGFESTFIKLGYTLLPTWIHFRKVGILDRVYDHDGDISTTYSGEKDFKQAGLIKTYNGYPYLKHWDAPCNRVSGSSNGPKLGNNLSPNETIYFFRKAVCRALPFEPIGEPFVNNFGISNALYKIKKDALDNGATNPENGCFCRRGNCLPVGLTDAMDCFYGFSLAISYPHFFEGDPSLTSRVDGLKPNAASHESYLHVNQARGALTHASVKLQVNAVFGDMSNVERCDKFSHMVLPLMWVEFLVPELPFNLKLALFALERLLPIGEIVLSISLLLLGAWLVAFSWKHFLVKSAKFAHHCAKITFPKKEKVGDVSGIEEAECA